MPEHGVNAIEKMGRVLEAAQWKAKPCGKKRIPCWEAALTITMIQGGSAINSVPDRAVILDRRYLPEEKQRLFGWTAQTANSFEHPG